MREVSMCAGCRVYFKGEGEYCSDQCSEDNPAGHQVKEIQSLLDRPLAGNTISWEEIQRVSALMDKYDLCPRLTSE